MNRLTRILLECTNLCGIKDGIQKCLAGKNLADFERTALIQHLQELSNDIIRLNLEIEKANGKRGVRTRGVLMVR